jgi:hypothetical protein
LATGRLRPICQGLLKPKTLFMTCLLDGEVYEMKYLISFLSI